MKPKIPETEYDKICELYLSGLSKEKLQKMYNVSNSVIDRIFTIKNIKCRDNSHKKRKYTLNENYFDNIDTPNKAYILGLLYSDGCNYTKTNHIKLELQARDKDILDKINSELNSNRKLKLNKLSEKNSNHSNTYRLSIINKHMSETLYNLGMIDNKSLKLTFPKWLDDYLIPHFIRGYLDGDGHIEWNNTRFISIASTKEFCEFLKEYVFKKFGFTSSIYNTTNKESNTKIFHLFKKERIKTFLDWIYSDADLFIQRKYNTYLKICSDMNK